MGERRLLSCQIDVGTIKKLKTRALNSGFKNKRKGRVLQNLNERDIEISFPYWVGWRK